jgi:hypothetical protein
MEGLTLVIVLVSLDSSLAVLTHWDELLIRIPPLTAWWHVLLEELPLQLLIMIIDLSNGPVIVFITRGDSIARLLASNLTHAGWLRAVEFILSLSPITIHKKSILVLPSALQHLLSTGDKHISISNVILM